MKYLALLCLVCAPLVISGCDEPGDGSLESCATALVGEIQGDKTGPVTALLSLDGSLQLDFAPEGEDRTTFAAADVDSVTGTLTATSEVMVLEGSFDFDTCDGSGTWTIANSTGDWELSLR